MNEGYAAGQDIAGASRQSQMEEQFGRLESALVELEKDINMLLDRIQPISRGTPPTAGPEGNKVAEALVPMAERIRRYSEHARTLSLMVKSGTGRLEL